MTAEITMRQLWWNHSLMDFFFRNQSEETLNELMDAVEENKATVLDTIDDYYDDLDECEEDFYNASVDDLIEQLSLTPIGIDEEEDDD